MPPTRWRDWYPHQIEKWRGSTAIQGMSDGAYRGYHFLLMAQWESSDGMLPNDEKELARMSGLHRRWMRFRSEILPNFIEVQKRLVNVSQKEKWDRAKEVYEKKARLHPESGQSVNGVSDDSHKNLTHECVSVSTSIPINTLSTKDKYNSEEKEIIQRVFNYYCRKFNRSSERYALTKSRFEKACARYRERLKIRGDPEKALADLKQAVDNLAASEFHRERNFIDWTDQIFRSEDEFQKRLNWVKSNGANHARIPIGKGEQTLDVLKGFIRDTEHRSLPSEVSIISPSEDRQRNTDDLF